MKKMLRIVMMIMLMMGTGGFSFPASKSKSMIGFFSPGSFYIYAMGSYNHFDPSGYYYLHLGSNSADALAPVLGIGYRVMDFNGRLFVSVEGDYSPARYNFGGYSRDQKIDLLTFMLNIEGSMAAKFPWIIYAGIGVGIHRLYDLDSGNTGKNHIPPVDETRTAMALDIGVKIPISRRLMIRTEFQWNGESYGTYYYTDDHWDVQWDETDWDSLSSSFSAGLELHF